MMQTQPSARRFSRASMKSTHGPLDEDRALARGIEAMVGIDQIQPIMFGGKLIAWAKGEQGSGGVSWRRPRAHEKWWMGWSSYDNLIDEVTNNGKKYRADWNRTFSASPVANNYYDLFPCTGAPTAGTYTASAKVARPMSDTDVGAMYHGGNMSPDTKHLLNASVQTTFATPIAFFLYDRCLTYEAVPFNAATPAAFTNTLPLTRYVADGEGGCKILCTGQTLTGATASTITALSYTNQAGTPSQVMPQTPSPAVIVNAAAPSTINGARVVSPSTTAATLPWGPHLPLATGDGGVRLIDSLTTSAANTGTMCFVLQRILACIPIPTNGCTSLVNLIQEVPSMERVRDGACLAVMTFNSVAVSFNLSGSIDFAWG